MKKIVSAVLTLALAATLSACGGNTAGTGADSTSAAKGPTVSQGVVTALGTGTAQKAALSLPSLGNPLTITVNGITYTITNAAITLDDIDAILAPFIKKGMVV